MTTRIFLVAVVSTVTLACRDGPAAPSSPTDYPQVGHVKQSTMAYVLASFEDVINDPLAVELVHTMSDDLVTARFQRLQTVVRTPRSPRDSLELHNLLTTTRTAVLNNSSTPDVSLRDALDLILQEAQAMLEDERGAGDVKTKRNSG